MKTSWWEENPDFRTARWKKERQERADHTLRRAGSRRLYRNTPRGRRATARAARKAAYGLSSEQYDALVLASCGRCTLCDHQDDDAAYSLVVDHCHATGVVRGLICGGCNWVLGWIETRGGDWMGRAATYLSGPCLPLAVWDK
jgi:recombination endonuclease VII